MSLATCGTYAGFQAHGKQGEPPCDPCREARNEYRRTRYRESRQSPRDRRLNAAYKLAERWLREAHREEFDRLREKAWRELGLERYVYVPRDGDKKQARNRITMLIGRGVLPPAKTIPCADCGHIGSDSRHSYDHHLGYAAEHHDDVQAVCYQCHHERERQRGTRY